jgi:nitroimidazol reductase NimA-like FMN-containing flavoprotein (pyridoxamine 5'-phosphate oxidase superfamily)
LKPEEIEFMKNHVLCRLATASRKGWPQVTPVTYALDGERPVIATDYGTKKLKNIVENPKVALIIDEFRPNKGLMIQGKCEIFEKGKEYLRLLKILFDRFEYYRANPWKEGESPILRIIPVRVTSWSL